MRRLRSFCARRKSCAEDCRLTARRMRFAQERVGGDAVGEEEEEEEEIEDSISERIVSAWAVWPRESKGIVMGTMVQPAALYLSRAHWHTARMEASARANQGSYIPMVLLEGRRILDKG